MSKHECVAPLGTPDWNGGAVRAESFKVTVAIPHLDTLEPLKMVIALMRKQSVKPYIVVVDTGSPPHVCKQLCKLRAPDLEVQEIKVHSLSHSSEPVTIALDVAHAVCRTKYLFHTHTDCFPRRRDLLESWMRICNSNTPVVGYRMSPRDWVKGKGAGEWKWMVGHTATMLYMPSIHRSGATWSMQRMRDAFRFSLEQVEGGWPDTETGFNHCLRQAGIVPYFEGDDENYTRYVDRNIDHVRSFAGSKIYATQFYADKAKQWMKDALAEGEARLKEWAIFDSIEDSNKD